MAASLADTVTYYYTPCAGVWQAHGAGQAGKIRNGPGRLNSAGRAPDLADGCRLHAARSRPPCIAVSQGGGQCLRKPARAAPVRPSPAGVVTPPCNAGQTDGKASPARGGAAAGGGGVRRLALPLPFRTAAACVGADALHRPASLRHRKAHGTMQASSLRTQGKALPGFGRCAAPPQVPQRKNSPAPGLWVRGCFSGMRAGRLGVSGRRIPGWLSPKQRLPV